MAERILLVAKRLRETRDGLEELWTKSNRNKARRKKIEKQLSGIDDEIMRLISIAIDEGTQEYRDATTALGGATTKVEEAIADTKKVAEALTAVAQAIGLVAMVVPVA
jgi:hypothetical protein